MQLSCLVEILFFKSKMIHLLNLCFSSCWIYIDIKQLFLKKSFLMFLAIFPKYNLNCIVVLIFDFLHFLDMSWFMDPGIQDSRIPEVPWNWLDLTDLTCRVLTPLRLCQETVFSIQSLKISSFWNSGYCLEMVNFLPILTCWALTQLYFCHWTWIWH